MRGALKDAGLAPADVEYVNAHGTSTPANDLNETQAIKAVFGDAREKRHVSSTKSATGHMLGAAGAVEFIVSALVDPRRHRPADDQLRRRPIRSATSTTRRTGRCSARCDAALSNSFGFGGHNVTLAVKRFEE